MRSASGAAIANLASGQWNHAELYDIQIAGGSVLSFSGIDSDITIGATLYKRGFVIVRGNLVSRVGVAEQTCQLTISQFADATTPALIGGRTLQQFINLGLLDNAVVTISEFFSGASANYQDGATVGLAQLFKGRVSAAKAGRLQSVITVTSGLALLNIDMPRNVVQTGCTHALFDAGCTLSKTAFTTSGAVSGSPGVLSFNTGLTQIDNYFNLGQVTFLTGVNAGLTRLIRSFVHASGVVKLFQPLPQAPGVGDTFNITPGCNKTQAQCRNASTGLGPPFNNIAHFDGDPYVPTPETLYDGGAVSTPTTGTGRQGHVTAGSQVGSSKNGGSYVP